jgi:hypothetical protein
MKSDAANLFSVSDIISLSYELSYSMGHFKCRSGVPFLDHLTDSLAGGTVLSWFAPAKRPQWVGRVPHLECAAPTPRHRLCSWSNQRCLRSRCCLALHCIQWHQECLNVIYLLFHRLLERLVLQCQLALPVPNQSHWCRAGPAAVTRIDCPCGRISPPFLRCRHRFLFDLKQCRSPNPPLPTIY